MSDVRGQEGTEVRGRRSEDRSERAGKDRGRRSEVGGQGKTEIGGQKSEIRSQEKTEVGGQKSEVRKRQRSEVSGQKTGKDRDRRSEVRSQRSGKDRYQRSEDRGQKTGKDRDRRRVFSEMDVPEPQDPYGVSKYEAEEVLKKVAVETGLEIVILRPPLVYGPGVKANFLRLLKLIHKGIPLPLGLVRNRRSMVYLGNLVSGILACLEHHRAAGETFLISDGEDVSTAELVQKMASAMGRRVVFLPVPVFMLKALGSLTGKRAEIDRLTGSLCVDSSKTREFLDWRAPYTFEQGIQETVDWYKK